MATHRFSHWLVRQVGHDAVLVSDRARVHGAAARSLEGAEASRREEDDALADAVLRGSGEDGASAGDWGRAANHWKLSGRPRRAALLLIGATRLALKSGATEGAVLHGRSAIAQADAAGDVPSATEASALSARSLNLLGRTDESTDALRRAQDRAISAELAAWPRVRLRVGLAAARIEHRLGRYDAALAAADAAAETARELSDGAAEADAVRTAALVRHDRAEHDLALATYARAMALADGAGDTYLVAACWNGIGGVRWRRGDLDGAEEAYGKAYEIALRIGDRRAQGGVLQNLANVRSQRSDFDGALARYRTVLALFDAVGDISGRALLLFNMGHVHVLLGRDDEALARIEDSLELRRKLREPWGTGVALVARAALRRDRGDLAEALADLNEAVVLFESLAARDVLADALSARAHARLQAGERAAAEADARRAVDLVSEDLLPGPAAAARMALAHCLGDLALAAESVALADRSDSEESRCAIRLRQAALLVQMAGATPPGSAERDAARTAAGELVRRAMQTGRLGIVREAEGLLTSLGSRCGDVAPLA